MRGLVVLAFPCNQFGNQEPGTDAQIAEFARSKGATFQVLAKTDVKGPEAHPLFRRLSIVRNGGGQPEWNFAKYLTGRDGVVRHRYGPALDVEALAADIEALL